MPDANGGYPGINPIGDYASLIAVGKDFYGIFSGNNTPNNTNFPNGVMYQRFANFATNQLFADAALTIPVGVSIDPFFFHVSLLAALSIDPDVTFPDPDPTVTFNPTDLGPVITPPLHWQLAAVASTHLCLAVEISTANDRIVAPSLVGRAPGWPTTDLAVINDNNKAQRNMGLSTTPARGVGLSETFYAIIHNAATFRRDIEIAVLVPPEWLRRMKGARVETVGGRPRTLERETRVVLPGVEPGENRWVGLTMVPPGGKPGEIVWTGFQEIVDGAVVNGFGVGTRLASTAECIVRTLELHRSVFTRIAALRKDELADEEVFHVSKLLEGRRVGAKGYVQFLKEGLRPLQTILAELRKGHQLGDPFAVARARTTFVKRLQTVRGTAVENLLVAHVDLLNRLDSFTTMLQLERGDVVDILQNVRWQRDLYTAVKALSALPAARQVRKLCDEFIGGIERREATYAEFPALLKRLRKSLDATAQARPRLGLAAQLKALDEAGDSLAELQRAHRGVLLKLSTQR